MNNKHICPYCEEFTPIKIRTEPETYTVRGEVVSIESKIAYCSVCRNQIWVDELDEENLNSAFDKYREIKNLLTPSRIKEIREKYNVTQVAFSRILGFGDKTISRYENGSIQDEAQNNLIMLADIPENFEALLEKNKSKISAEDYKKASDALDSHHPIIITSNMEYNVRNTGYNYEFTKSSAYFGGFGGRQHAC